MVEKLASSEIAESRERFQIAHQGAFHIEELKLLPSGMHYLNPTVEERWLTWQAAERDTRERIGQAKMMWGWDIEEIKSAMRQFQSKHPGKLPSEIERAERIRGKE